MEKIGRYHIVRQLGHGGMGRVYLARDPSLERDVALKVLHREAKQAGLREEAKALAALNHPSIVTVYEIGEHGGQDFIAMEYLPGRSLRQLLAEPDLAARRESLLAICSHVAVALGAAHRAGILHRDIKPENIIVSPGGDVKVVDFGIARRLESVERPPARAITATELAEVLTRSVPAVDEPDTIVSAGTETMFGTPAYMAPEVLLGEGSSEPSDIYSLGIVIYECIVGRRPYAGSHLHEVIAQMIDGPPLTLDEPLGPLLARMLVRDPAQRPSTGDVVAALQPRTQVAMPPRRNWLPVLAGAVLVALASITWRVVTGDAPPPPPPPPMVAPLSATIAVAPCAIEMPSYGAEPARPPILADTLARLLGEVSGARLSGVAIAVDAADSRDSAKLLGAGYLATIKITEHASELHASVELANVANGARVKAFALTAPSPRLAQLLDDAAEQLGQAIAPTARLDRAANRMRAQMFYRQGRDILETAHFTDARPYLEQAVDADPTFFEGWYSLTLVLGWMEAPESLILEATDKALAATAVGPKRDLMIGVASYMRGEYEQARLMLAPLVDATGPGAPDPKELYYYLGETNWHDGRHTVAVDYFQRALSADKLFRPAAIHVEQYALARRDERLARYVIGLLADETEPVEMAMRHYRAVASGSKFRSNLDAQLILGDKPSPELESRLQGPGIDATTYRIAREVQTGEMTRARSQLTELWQHDIAGKPLDPNQLFELEGLGEVIVAAGMADESRQLVEVLAHASEGRHAAVRGYHRFASLTAGLARDATLIVHDAVSERNARLADAIEAELAKDHTKAAKILDELVHDPTASWDYPERAALLRNLQSLGRKKDVAALCAETLEPAVYRYAYLVLRRLCHAH